ncbi:MAG: response regulator [Bacteroidales bacterium]|nr:response regulator [Bacteroidales bacterium]MBR0540117.1 response regulator [Bacteroidales bacterium]
MAKKRKNDYPSGTRTSWKVVITYTFVIALCAALFYYIFNLRSTIESQRSNINSQHAALQWANRFTKNVHEAQSAANLYAFTKQTRYKRRFNEAKKLISAQVDSIVMIEINEDNKTMVKEIDGLIKSKGSISNELSKQFHDFNPLAEFDRTIDDYMPPEPEEEIVVTKISKDTIIHVPRNQKKGFWRRIGNVFNPTEEDSIVHVSIESTDTLHIQRQSNDSLTILADLRLLSDQAKAEYWNKIKEYESKTQELVRADNQLSEQISNLLIHLNQEILDSTIAEIEKSEAAIKENIRTSILIGAITLFLIVIFIILIISDVNKGHRARQAAEEAKKKTEEIMESRHKLLLSVSHDIKTPLSSILGNVELMDKTGNEKEFSSIQQSADHILNLLNNLLEYSSLEQGKLQIRNESFNLRQICDETAEMFRPIAKHKNLDFVYEPDMEEDSFILSDRLKIKQILSNIISNGIKYTLEGSVCFKARIGRNLVVFDITDTGVGIPPDKLEDVFKPFVRIETYNQFAEGSGYGMSVVKGLVDLLGGEIHIESEVGKGTHFEVRIPVGNVEKPIEEDGEVNSDKKKSLNILVIDDDNTLLSVIDTMLHRLGHQAIACRSKNDIESAIAQIHDYDYVLTDREMGALTGNDILHMFKEADPDKPVILMTARIEYSNEIAKEEGFDGFLQKPFNLKQLESLFGSVAVAESEQEIAFPDFPSFSEMMGNDRPSMTDILSVFVKSTSDDLMTMNALIEASDFIEMQALCHKMLPMFTQLERDTTFLSKMNGMRGKGDTEESYPNWKEDAIQFMSQADELLDLLAEKYGIE